MHDSVQRALRAALNATPAVRIVYTKAVTPDAYFLTPRPTNAVLFVSDVYAAASASEEQAFSGDEDLSRWAA